MSGRLTAAARPKAFVRTPPRWRFALLGLVLLGVQGNSGFAAEPGGEEAAIRRTVQDLLDSWREADAAKGEAVLHPEFRLTTRRDNVAADDPSPPTDLPALSVAPRAAMMRIYTAVRPGAWDDRLSDTVVHWDPSGLAVLWSRYRFHIDGHLSHCGAVTFTLYKLRDRWQIVDFADTHHWAEPGEANGCAPPSAGAQPAAG